MDIGYISLKDAATYLSLSPKTLYEWVENGKMPAYKLGRVWRFSRQELDVYARKNSYNTSASPSKDDAARVRLKGGTH